MKKTVTSAILALALATGCSAAPSASSAEEARRSYMSAPWSPPEMTGETERVHPDSAKLAELAENLYRRAPWSPPAAE